MSIERVEHLKKKTIISILEPTHFGHSDNRRDVIISHEAPKVYTITREQLEQRLSGVTFGLPNTMDKVDIPEVGTVIFINQFDNDYSSSTWRSGVHNVSQPYLLVEEVFQHTVFDEVCQLIIPDFEQITTELIMYFAKHPNELYQLDPRKFEKLLEVIFRNLGYDTQLGPGHGDGGVDLRLIHKDSIGEFMTLVQAKRYAPDRPIRLEAVQALYGIVEANRANRGLFVTTSRYLPGVMKFAQCNNSRLVLATSKDVAIWCEQTARNKAKT
jgi:hypothetical protein